MVKKKLENGLKAKEYVGLQKEQLLLSLKILILVELITKLKDKLLKKIIKIYSDEFHKTIFKKNFNF